MSATMSEKTGMNKFMHASYGLCLFGGCGATSYLCSCTSCITLSNIVSGGGHLVPRVCCLSFSRSKHPLTLYPPKQTGSLSPFGAPPHPLPYDSSLVHSMRLNGCSSRSSQYAQHCTLVFSSLLQLLYNPLHTLNMCILPLSRYF